MSPRDHAAAPWSRSRRLRPRSRVQGAGTVAVGVAMVVRPRVVRPTVRQGPSRPRRAVLGLVAEAAAVVRPGSIGRQVPHLGRRARRRAGLRTIRAHRVHARGLRTIRAHRVHARRGLRTTRAHRVHARRGLRRKRGQPERGTRRTHPSVASVGVGVAVASHPRWPAARIEPRSAALPSYSARLRIGTGTGAAASTPQARCATRAVGASEDAARELGVHWADVVVRDPTSTRRRSAPPVAPGCGPAPERRLLFAYGRAPTHPWIRRGRRCGS